MKGTAEGGRSRRKCSPFFPREISKKCLWNCKRTMQRVTAKVLNWKIFPFDQLIDELIVCQKMPSSIVALLPFSNSLSLFIQSTLFSVKKKTRLLDMEKQQTLIVLLIVLSFLEYDASHIFFVL